MRPLALHRPHSRPPHAAPSAQSAASASACCPPMPSRLPSPLAVTPFQHLIVGDCFPTAVRWRVGAAAGGWAHPLPGRWARLGAFGSTFGGAVRSACNSSAWHRSFEPGLMLCSLQSWLQGAPPQGWFSRVGHGCTPAGGRAHPRPTGGARSPRSAECGALLRACQVCSLQLVRAGRAARWTGVDQVRFQGAGRV